MFYSHRDSPRVAVPVAVPDTRFTLNYWRGVCIIAGVHRESPNRAKPLCKVTPRRASQLQWLPSCTLTAVLEHINVRWAAGCVWARRGLREFGSLLGLVCVEAHGTVERTRGQLRVERAEGDVYDGLRVAQAFDEPARARVIQVGRAVLGARGHVPKARRERRADWVYSVDVRAEPAHARGRSQIPQLDRAVESVRDIWGAVVQAGGTTFWETSHPSDASIMPPGPAPPGAEQ